jgi:hypothetical protein
VDWTELERLITDTEITSEMVWNEPEKLSTEEAMTGATLGIVRPELEKNGRSNRINARNCVARVK